MATSGESPSARINSGEKKVAPSTPEAMATGAMRMAAGSMYQNSRLTSAPPSNNFHAATVEASSP